MTTANYKSPIGTLIISANDDHIISILFANSSRGKTVDEKQLDYSLPAEPLLRRCFDQLDEYFDGKRKTFDVPVMHTGTDFQKSVWQMLNQIPYGKVWSYLELSKKLGNPKAIRAVGQTNGNNQVCIIVPCHRVIGSDGELTGYGGDLWRKKWLLDHEATFENGVQKLF